MQSYEEALNFMIYLIEEQVKHPKGIEQGYQVFDKDANFITRIGRHSLNPPWYREFYAKYGRKPTKREIPQLAKKMLEQGYYDEFGYIPPFRQQQQMFNYK